MERIGIYTPGKDLAGSRRSSVICSRQTGNGVKQNNNIMPALYQTFSLLQYNIGDLYMAVCRFIEGRRNHFSPDTTGHISYFFRTLID
ncbi:hypothetical protein D9M68_822850 [compost metagenome]